MLDRPGQTKDGGAGGTGRNTSANSDQTSSVDQLTSSIEEGKQYAGADVLKLVKDALSADGREQKDRAEKAEANATKLTSDLNGMTTQVNTLTGQMAEFARAQNDAEADSVKEDPAALASLRVRQANTAEKLRLDGVNTAYQTRDTEFKQTQADFAKEKSGFNIKLAAMAAGVDAVKLAELVPDGDPTRLTNAATLLKTQVAPEIDPVTRLPKVAPKIPGLTTTPATLTSVAGDSRSVSEKMLASAKAK